MNLKILFISFIIYSMIGWLMEVICKLIQYKRFINRGFMIGPWCPIYGIGSISLVLLLDNYKNNPVVLFFMAILICSVIEYTISFVMEKLFNARWWDYSNKKFNVNGRICLNTMIPFGILGVLVVYFVNPFIYNLLSKIPLNVLNIIVYSLLIIFIIDFIISFDIIFKFKDTLKKTEKDSTEEISKRVREVFLSKGVLYRRLVKAFPNFKNRKEYLTELRNRINDKLKKLN